MLNFSKSFATLCALICTPAAAAPRTDIITLSTATQPPLNFTALPYANPNAPKGGAFTTAAIGSFDNLNPFILAGSAPDSIFNIWQPLFKPSDTDSVTAYADLAQSVDIARENRAVTFHLNPKAKFSDGTSVTAADVIWTYQTLTTQGAPIYTDLYANIATSTAQNPTTVTFTFQTPASPAQILNLAEMYILPAHFWKGKNFSQPLQTYPIGSGPYQVAAATRGASITYNHVPYWWAAALPSNRGFYNFQTVTQQFFQTDQSALQAFKARQLDARIEKSPALWSTAYKPQPSLTLEQPTLTLPAGITGLALNTRRPLFTDIRVRQALALAFNFAWTNRVIFQNAQHQETSYFTNSPMASTNISTIPAENSDGDNLRQLRQSLSLLTAAGWHTTATRFINNAGQPFTFQILIATPADANILIPYVATLRSLGITATIEAADPATYQRRVQNYDFDATPTTIPATGYPDTEQRAYWGCAAAYAATGNNLAGVCTKAIDAALTAETTAQNLTQKTIAIHTLDRLLLAGWYIIPWGATSHENLAYWSDKVAHPCAPLQIGTDYDLWWAK